VVQNFQFGFGFSEQLGASNWQGDRAILPANDIFSIINNSFFTKELFPLSRFIGTRMDV
jgi:hypothetical protein